MQVARLDDVCEINPRMPRTLADDDLASFLPMAAVSEGGQVELEEEREVRQVKKGYTYFERGDVLVAKITPCFENGKAARTHNLSKPFGFGSTEFHVLRAGKEVNPSYLFHMVWNSRFREVGASNMTGSAGQKRVPADFLKRHEIPLPPLPEQQRIAAILDKADTLRRKRKRAIELLDSVTHSTFLEMFGHSLGPNAKPLSEVVDASDRINYGVVQPGDDEPEGVSLVRVSDLAGGVVDHTNLRKVSKAISHQHGRSVLKGYEILVSCVGSIGEVAVATERERGFNVARAVARVPISDPFVRSYVAEFLRTSRVQQYFNKELRTVSQPTLNIKQISETLIELPPEASLKAFHEAVDIFVKCKRSASRHKLQTDSLFSSLQNRAFSGQL